MKRYTKTLAIILTVILSAMLVGCSASGIAPSGPSDVLGEGQENTSFVSGEVNRKIVYTVNMTVETDAVSELKNRLSSKNKDLGGYVSNMSESYDDGKCSYIDITFKVPTEHLDEFLGDIEGSSKVIRKNVKTTDITTEYVNAQSRKKSLEERRSLLEEMLDDDIAAGDKLSIINEISQVSAEIQSIELMIKGYDSSVDYSTVAITLRAEETFLEKIKPLIIISVLLLIYVGIPLLIVFIIKKHKKRKQNAR